MQTVHLGVTTNGVMLTHVIAMLTRHNPRTLLVNRMPTRTPHVAVWIHIQHQPRPSLQTVLQAGPVAVALIHN